MAQGENENSIPINIEEEIKQPESSLINKIGKSKCVYNIKINLEDDEKFQMKRGTPNLAIS